MTTTTTAAGLTTLFAAGFDVCIFATSLAAKAYRPAKIAEFAGAVRQLAPRVPTSPAVAAVLAGEAAVVLSLLLGAPVVGLALAAVLVSLFTVTIAGAIRGRRRVACQCFGQSEAPVSTVHIVRNGVILAVTLAGLLARPFGPGSSPGLGSAAIGVLGVAVVAAACTVVIDRFSDLFVLNPKEQ
jgi:hypothetical protein